jgi:hypothetical protein
MACELMHCQRTRRTLPTARVGQLRTNGLLSRGWSNSVGGRMRVERSLLADSWNAHYAALGFDQDAEDPPLLKPAVNELAEADGMS